MKENYSEEWRVHNFSWGPASWLFFTWCESHEFGSLLGKLPLDNGGKESSGYGKIAKFSYILTAKQKNVLLKKSCSKASFCSILQNNLYSSTTLSLPIDFFFFSKLSRMAYLLQTCPVKSKLADQSVCFTTLAGGKNFGGSRCYISQVAAE